MSQALDGSIMTKLQCIMHFGGVPGYCFYDAVQFIIRGWVSAPLRENKVDGVKEAGKRLGEVSCFIWLKRILQILLWTGEKKKKKNIKIVIPLLHKVYVKQVNDKTCKDKVFSGSCCTLKSSPMFRSSNYYHFMYSEYMVLF